MRRFLILIIALCILSALVYILGRTAPPPGYAVVVRSRLGGAVSVRTGTSFWTAPLLSTKHLYPVGSQSDTLFFEPGAFATSESEPVGLDVVVHGNISVRDLPELDRLCRGRHVETLQSITGRILTPLFERTGTLETFRTAYGPLRESVLEAMRREEALAPFAIADVEIVAIHFDPDTERQLVQSLVPESRSGPKIVIVGVDGADWDIIDPMIREGELPNFARLIRQGTRASLRSIQPMLSPRIWTSIATGKYPEEHGITDFMIKDPASGRMVPVTSNVRRSRALWNILTDLEMPVGFVGWLATWPAEEVCGFMVSDRMAYYAFNPDRPIDQSPRKTYPDALFNSLGPLVKDYSDVRYEDVQRFLDVPRSDFNRQAEGGYDPGDPVHNMRLIYATTETYRRIGLHQIREPVRLFGLYFELVDTVSHLFVRHMPPRLSQVTDEEYARFRNAVFEAYRYQDEILGEILKELDEDTILIVLSDHGFRTGAKRLVEESIAAGGQLLRIGHGGRAARAVLDHAPLGILVIRGPGIRSGATIEAASVMDIAPTVLYLLGLPVGRDMPGRVLLETVNPDFATEHPVLRIAGYDTGEPRQTEAPIASTDDEALMEKLAALGYIDRGQEENPAKIGLRLLQEGKAADAIPCLKEALEAKPAAAGLWASLGLAYLSVGRADDAEQALREALKHNPDSPSALSNLAVVLTQKDQYEAAAQALEHAVRLAPDNPRMRDNLGVLRVHLGQLEEARREFMRAIELEPRMPEPYNNLGAVAMQLDDLDEARTQLEKALTLSPGFLEAHLNLGRLALEDGRPGEALESFRRVLDGDPDNVEALLYEGQAHRLLGQMNEAREAWRKAAESDPNGDLGKQARRFLKE